MNGDTVTSLTLGDPTAGTGTQTLDIAGQASVSNSNQTLNDVFVAVSSSAAINPDGKLIIGATGAGTGNNGPDGGAADLIIDSSSSAPATLTNAGTIIAQTSDSVWGESLDVGGTLTNTGTIADESGKLTFQGQQVPYVVDNTGSMSVAAGAVFTMLAGDGSSFTNHGTFANQGTATVQQTMHWIQNGGSETGNPVQLTGQETLEDSAGTGSFAVTNCAGAGLTGTIPAGQTITVVGGCSGTTLNLNPPSVTNDGTLILDAPTGGSDGIVQRSELINHGTLDSTVADPKLANQLLVPLINAAGATVNLTGGELEQTTGSATTNAGTVHIAPGALWLVQAGSFTNSGTLVPQVASATSFGQFNLTVGSKFNAGGTLAPSLISGFKPAAGTEFPEIEMNGGSVSGKFHSVSGGFSADYTKETASPPYFGIVYGKGAKRPSLKVGKVSGGAGSVSVKVSCTSGSGKCPKTTVTASVKKGKKTVTVGKGSVTLSAGKSKTLTVKVSKTGKVLVTVSANKKKLKSATVTVRKRKKK
jgi:hypothetical protein